MLFNSLSRLSSRKRRSRVFRQVFTRSRQIEVELLEHRVVLSADSLILALFNRLGSGSCSREIPREVVAA